MSTSKSTRFWDRVAKRYAEQPVADEAAYQKKLEVTRTYMHPDMEVLEFGCGTGTTAIAHAPYIKQILATDISSKMIEIAQSKAVAEDIQNVTFEQATLDAYSHAGCKWDMILGLSILHLQDNWKEVITQVYQMLRPDGLFVSSTLCIGETMPYMRFIAPIGAFVGLMPPIVIFRIDELTTALTDAGFEIDHQWQPAKGKSLFVVAKK